MSETRIELCKKYFESQSLDPKDVDLVMSQTNVSSDVATFFLYKHGQDIVNAIMDVYDPYGPVNLNKEIQNCTDLSETIVSKYLEMNNGSAMETIKYIFNNLDENGKEKEIIIDI